MLVGIGGYAKSGKDAFADRLVSNDDFVKRFFSWGVNEALLRIDPWLPYALELDDVWPDCTEYTDDLIRYSALFELCGGYDGYDHFKEHPEVRRLMQKMGTEVGRQMFGEQVWIDMLSDQLAGLEENVVVTGVRYPNEMEWLEQAGGISVWVNRPGFGPVNTHSSDNSLGPEHFKIIIENDGTLEDLYLHADALTTVVFMPGGVGAGQTTVVGQ